MRRVCVVGAVLGCWLAAGTAAQAAVTQPPEPLDPSPLNGDTEYLVNQASGLQADARAVVSPRSFSSLGQRWAMTKAPNGNWRISNVGNGRCLDAASSVSEVKCAVNSPSQEWSFTYVTNG